MYVCISCIIYLHCITPISKGLILLGLPPNELFVHFNASSFIAPYLHQLSAVIQKMYLFGAILLYLMPFNIIIKRVDAGTAHYKGALWDKFSTKASKKAPCVISN